MSYSGGLPFQIRIIEARNLKRADINRSSDPYVEVKLKGHMRAIYKTRVAKKDLYPIWNETFSFNPSNPQRDIVTLKLWDHDTLTPDDFLGKVSIPVRQYLNRGPVDEWLILTNNKGNKYSQGELHIQVQYGSFIGASAPGMFPQQQMNTQPGYPQQMPYNPQGITHQYGQSQPYPQATQPYPPSQQYAQPPQQYVPAPYPPAPYPPAQMPPAQGYPQYSSGYPPAQGVSQRQGGASGLVGQILDRLNRY